MALLLNSPELESAVAQFAARTGQDDQLVVERAVREGLARLVAAEEMIARVRATIAKYKHLPVLDTRTPDEILGYDENGLPT